MWMEIPAASNHHNQAVNHVLARFSLIDYPGSLDFIWSLIPLIQCPVVVVDTAHCPNTAGVSGSSEGPNYRDETTLCAYKFRATSAFVQVSEGPLLETVPCFLLDMSFEALRLKLAHWCH